MMVVVVLAVFAVMRLAMVSERERNNHVSSEAWSIIPRRHAEMSALMWSDYKEDHWKLKDSSEKSQGANQPGGDHRQARPSTCPGNCPSIPKPTEPRGSLKKTMDEEHAALLGFITNDQLSKLALRELSLPDISFIENDENAIAMITFQVLKV